MARLDHNDVARLLVKRPEELVSEFAAAASRDLGVSRVGAWLPTAHPELWGTQVIWQRASGVRTIVRPHEAYDSPAFQGSPGQAVIEARRPLRWVLAPDAELPYEVLREIRSQGATDYLIVPLDSLQMEGWIAWATDRPEGFSAADLDALLRRARDAEAPLALAVARNATASLLRVYLGANAATRVMAGAFRRGTGTLIEAALWFCDLRGFTELSDTRPASEVVTLLDRYFEAVAGPIEDGGGEILKFIGDAVLAVFPFGEAGAQPACRGALRAAEQALEAVAGIPPLRIGVALHAGEVIYGNIGGRSRLDFTVIGAAVNEVCRVEAACKEIGEPLLITGAFAERVGQDVALRSVGARLLRGVSAPTELFAPARGNASS